MHNVAYGEIVRLFRINTHIELFIENVCELFIYCVREKQYSYERLYKCFKDFADQVGEYNRYNASTQQILRTYEKVAKHRLMYVII